VEIAILFVLILLNGAFAMSEIALVSARKARLQRYLDDGDKAATVAVRLHQEPTHFLSTVQIGITSISILNGIIGDAVLSEPVSIWLQSYGMEPRASQIAATALVVVTITYFSIVLGELCRSASASSIPRRSRAAWRSRSISSPRFRSRS